jgi:hypothetical protein
LLPKTIARLFALVDRGLHSTAVRVAGAVAAGYQIAGGSTIAVGGCCKSMVARLGVGSSLAVATTLPGFMASEEVPRSNTKASRTSIRVLRSGRQTIWKLKIAGGQAG